MKRLPPTLPAFVMPLLALALLAAAPAGTAPAQEAVAQEVVAGTVSGTVRSGTDDAVLLDGVHVELITLNGEGALTTQATTTSAGRFQFTVPADASLTHLLRAVHRDVQYFAPEVVLLSPALPSAEREIMVYETTTVAPDLRIVATVLDVIALDRLNAELTLLREDLVVNPGVRTYTGTERGVTLRLPVPEAVIEAEGNVMLAGGLPGGGSFALAGGRLEVSIPLRPGETTIITRYRVGYDRARDAYTLAAATPLPTGRIELRLPERFVDEVRVLEGSTLGARREMGGETVLVVVASEGAQSGSRAAAELRGLAGRRPTNPLTERGGAAVASVLALAALLGGFALVRAFASRRSSAGGAR